MIRNRVVFGTDFLEYSLIHSPLGPDKILFRQKHQKRADSRVIL